MTARTALDFALAALGSLVVTLMCAIAIGKLIRDRGSRRTAMRKEYVRPKVLALLDEPGPDRHEHALAGRDESIAVDLIAGLLPKLRGHDRDALVAVLVDLGLIATAVRHCSARRRTRRLAAIELLGAAGIPSSAVTLTALLTHRDAETRMSAARSLGRIGDTSYARELIDSLTARRPIPVNTVSMALLRGGPGSAPALIDALRSESPVARGVAAELLGSLGVSRSATALEALLDDGDAAVRRTTTRALGRLGVPAAAKPIARVLAMQLARPDHERDTDLCVASIVALGQIGNRRAIPLLTESLSRSHRLSFAAAGALSAIGPRRSPTSIRRRRDERFVERTVAQLLEVAPTSAAT